MADPTRARILMSLLEKPGYPAELARDLELMRSNVSNHLTCLRGDHRSHRWHCRVLRLAAVSLAVMPFLSWFERRTGRELGSASAIKEGLEAWKGDTSAVPISALTGEREVEACDCC